MELQSRGPSRRSAIITALDMLAFCKLPAEMGPSAEIIDYHQNLYSSNAAARTSAGGKGWKGIDAKTLIADLDTAGIQRAAVLSVAYDFANPHKPAVPNEYEHVKAENDWTGAQIAAPETVRWVLQRKSPQAIRSRRDCALRKESKPAYRTSSPLRQL